MALRRLRLRLTRLVPLPGWLSWSGIGFALRTTAASLVALNIAFQMQLDDPKWAAMTVWIVAQDSRGMSQSKSLYRLLGTVIGAVFGVASIAMFAQYPELLLITLAAWLAICTAISSGLRNFRSYGAVLAGYTAVIIALDASADPASVFDITIARVTYIALGIIIEALFSSILAPGEPLRGVQAQLSGYLRQARDLSARTLRGEFTAPAFRRLFQGALDVDTAAGYAAGISPTVRRRLGHLRATMAATLRQLAAARALHEHLGGAPPRDEALLADTSRMLDEAARTGEADPAILAALRARIEAELIAQAQLVDHAIPPGLLVADRLNALLGAVDEALAHQARFGDGSAAPAQVSFAVHVDHVAAAQNGLRTFIAVLAAASFWLFTAWTSGAGFVVILGVICALFSTRPNPVAGAVGFLKGGIVAVILGGICNFAIIPLLSDFGALAIVLGGFLLAAGLAMRHPRTAAPATVFSFLFLDLTIGDNAVRVDGLSYLNGALALLLGIAVSAVVFALVLPVDPYATRRRLHRSVLRDLASIGRNPARWSQERWYSKTADRLAQYVLTGSGVPARQAEANFDGLLAALTIGDAVIALGGLARQRPSLRRPVDAVRRRLSSGDPASLERAARLAARRVSQGIRRESLPAHQDEIRAAVRLHELAEAVSAHAAYLRSDQLPARAFSQMATATAPPSGAPTARAPR